MGKLVAGIGLYEKGHYPCRIENVPTKEYSLWTQMLMRCQPNGIQQTKRPTYIGCSVHPDFIKFQDFAEWCQNQIGFGNPGWALDKDILMQNNKVYGPDTCCFVPREMNLLLTHKRSNQGDYPTGVVCRAGRYTSQIRINSVQTHLGSFDTSEAAEMAYKTAKIDEILRQAEIWKSAIDSRVYNALLSYKV